MKNSKIVSVVIITIVALFTLNMFSRSKGLSNNNPQIGLGTKVISKDSLIKTGTAALDPPTTWAVMATHVIGLDMLAWKMELAMEGSLYVAKSQKYIAAKNHFESKLD